SGAQPRVASANTARAVVCVLRRPSTSGNRTPVSTAVAVAGFMNPAYGFPVSPPSRSRRVGRRHRRRGLPDELGLRTAWRGDNVLEQRQDEHPADGEEYS